MSLINSAYLGESIKIDLGCKNFLQQEATLVDSTVLGGSSIIYSNSFSMKDYDRVSVLISAGPLPTTGSPVIGKILVGDSTTDPTSMSSLVGAVVNLATASTGATFVAIKAFDLVFGGAWSSAATYSITIDGKVFDGATAAVSSSLLYNSSDGTSIPESLATLIPVHCTYLKVDKLASASTYYRLRISPKLEGDRVITVSATAKDLCPGAANANLWGIQCVAVNGMIEFNANDIVATNSSYTNFAVKMTANSSVIPMEAVILRYPARAANGTAMQCAPDSTRSYAITRL